MSSTTGTIRSPRLIRGGTSGDTGAAQLDGTVLFGWRVGAPVHVEFQTVPGTTGCVGAPPGATCFREQSTSAGPTGLNVPQHNAACVIRRLGCSGQPSLSARARLQLLEPESNNSGHPGLSAGK